MQGFPVFSFAFALLGIYFLGCCVIAIISYRKMFFPVFRTLDYTLTHALEGGETNSDFLALPWETVRIDCPRRSSFMEVLLLSSTAQVPTGIAIFVHGIAWTRYGMLKYMAPFVSAGWHVIAPDLPGHGGSPHGTVPAPAFGYEEKYDLDLVVDWSRKRFGKDLAIVLLGESMGAATVLQYVPLGAPPGTSGGASREFWKISAVVADCSYSSADMELRARLSSSGIPRIFLGPALSMVSAMLRILRGYDLSDPAPEKAILESPVPILFIHGSEDAYVPTEMSVRMAERRRSAAIGPTELLVIKGARHGKSVLEDPMGWYSAVFTFVQRYAKKPQNG